MVRALTGRVLPTLRSVGVAVAAVETAEMANQAEAAPALRRAAEEVAHLILNVTMQI